jgi:shikimate kinase
MGSGKTTLGRLLAASLQGAFVDLDAEVESKSGCRIREMMTTHGELAFRRAELAALQQVVSQRVASGSAVSQVVATGGGIVETPQAMPVLRQFDAVVWLRADPQICVARLGAQSTSRPLLDDAAIWQQRWRQRQPLYEALADVSIDTEHLDTAGSLALLLHWLDSR